MKIIITGATSFIGSALIRHLVSKGDTVYAVVRPQSARQHTLDIPGLKIILLDLCDIERTSGIQELRNSDVWLHFGWEGVGSIGRSNPEIQKRNILYSTKALAAAAQLGCGKFFFSGSQAEYGICNGSTDELHKCVPVSEYGKAKLSFGQKAMKICSTLSMQYYHLRIYSVYGPGDHATSLVQTCVDRFSTGETVELGACTQMWNFLYITDCVSAITALIKGSAPEGIYNIASTDTRILRSFVDEINSIYGNRGRSVFGVRLPNAEGQSSLIPDISKLTKATGWKEQTSFREGVISIRRPVI